jgi:nitrate/TMAO reductase-like tetraheme cytochrome c subunit
MWGGKKTVNLAADNGVSNLCLKCHQPRPQTNLQNGNVQDYAAVAANPKGIAWDALNPTATTNIIRPSYRMHLHYGTVGTALAGVGGVEFAGTMAYSSSAHASAASCIDCHMGTGVVGKAGGHSFFAKGNFTTCNTAGCHQSPIDATNTTYWVNPRNETKTLLESLAAKLVVNGVEIMNQSDDQEANLWYALTAKHYDGYLNVYDPALNPGGVGSANETGPFQNPAPSSSWTAEQKAFNLTLPKLSLTNAQYGAILNFQFCLREYSLGIHNFKYTKALLTNSIAVL